MARLEASDLLVVEEAAPASAFNVKVASSDEEADEMARPPCRTRERMGGGTRTRRSLGG